MNRDALQTWQAKQLLDTLYPSLNFLFRLRRRMEKVGFPPNDPLFLHVCNAYDSMFKLRVELHYLSCKSGVGRPERDG
jgi:hypothetical protein